MRAPAESTSQTMGSSWRSACSVIRTIFSTVRAPHDPAFTVGSLAMTQTGRPSTRPDPGHHAVGREVGLVGVGEEPVLDEGAGIDEECETLAHGQLLLFGQLVAIAPDVAGQGPIDAGAEAPPGSSLTRPAAPDRGR